MERKYTKLVLKENLPKILWAYYQYYRPSCTFGRGRRYAFGVTELQRRYGSVDKLPVWHTGLQKSGGMAYRPIRYQLHLCIYIYIGYI